MARGFQRWLESTDGLSDACFWLRFNDIRGAEYVRHAVRHAAP